MSTLGIPFTHKTHPRSRSVKIHIEKNGDVVVVTPLRFPKYRVAEYVEKAREWILNAQSKLKESQQLKSSDEILYFGKPYTVVFESTMDGNIHLQKDSLVVSPASGKKADTKTLLDRWLKARAQEYILTRVYALAREMSVEFSGLKFGQQKTRWGSCSSTKSLTFNWRLIHAPTQVIDYVIVHELAHTKHMNHGSQFWDLVAEYDPDYPLHRGWLKRNGNSTD